MSSPLTNVLACIFSYFLTLAAHLVHLCPIRVSAIDERLSRVLYERTMYRALYLPSSLFFVSRYRHIVDVVRGASFPSKVG